MSTLHIYTYCNKTSGLFIFSPSQGISIDISLAEEDNACVNHNYPLHIVIYIPATVTETASPVCIMIVKKFLDFLFNAELVFQYVYIA